MDAIALRKNLSRLLGEHMLMMGKDGKKITNKKYGRKIGIHYKTIERYLRKRGNPELNTLVKIADNMGLNLIEFFFDEKVHPKIK